jgi:putative two-component system hydrogenase maturation factor HypX/HoxX
MRLLFLTHAFNSLTQRLYVECVRWGHEVSIEFDVHDSVTEEAIDLWRPELVVAPYLRRPIPASVWQRVPCLVVHPGPVGDRGPSALDWAVLRGAPEWGVTLLQAEAEMDAGPVWAARRFPMRLARKSSLYRHEVTEAAVACLHEALAVHATGDFVPTPLAEHAEREGGGWQPLLTQAERAIDWQRDPTLEVLRKLHASDGMPGVSDPTLGEGLYLFNGAATQDLHGSPGELLACRDDGAVCRATVDGAVWIGHLRRGLPRDEALKLPAADVLGTRVASLPEVTCDPYSAGEEEALRYHEANGVGHLEFAFHNGAMNSDQCARLRGVLADVKRRDVRVLVLHGGPDFWCNGMHLNAIEAADSAADASWANINAIDDLALEIIGCERQLTIAALAGNAGAGGVFLALAADRVVLRDGVVLNPHYKSMGNLFGSEYWTYQLPRRVGDAAARELTANRLPVGSHEALALGLVDAVQPGDVATFRAAVTAEAEALAAAPGLEKRLEEKRRRRARDEATRALVAYRADELEQMRRNFYGFDPSYHVARYNFVFKVPHSRTPLYLARHRR